MSSGAEPFGVAPDLEAVPAPCRGCRRPARGRSARARRPLPSTGGTGSPNDPDGSPTCAVKSPRISTATWPRSWNRRSRRSTTAKPRWMSDAVGSIPSFTRSGRPRSSLASQLLLGDDVDRARGQQLHLAVHTPAGGVGAHRSFRSAPRGLRRRGSAPSARCPRRTTVTPASRASAGSCRSAGRVVQHRVEGVTTDVTHERVVAGSREVRECERECPTVGA